MISIKDVNFFGKKVLIRVDYNVPIDEQGNVLDDTRIKESIPTIRKVIDDGGSAILVSHLGRPKGKDKKYSLKPIVNVLEKYLKDRVVFIEESLEEELEKVKGKINNAKIVLLENIRFYEGEEKGSEELAKKLASLADVYINDAFATAHREHSSTATVAKFFGKNSYFGFLMENEINNLNKVLFNSERPLTAIIGGAKVSTKIGVIENLIERVDNLLIGGGMAFTFIKALGGNIGNSLYEPDYLSTALNIINKSMLKSVNLLLPVDVIIADEISDKAKIDIKNSYEIPENFKGLDIGPKTIKKFAEVILRSKTILWNGPMGVFEVTPFNKGTYAISLILSAATLNGSYTLVGGGDSISALNQFNLSNFMSYISTAGGAMLEYLEGKTLPGIYAIEKNFQT